MSVTRHAVIVTPFVKASGEDWLTRFAIIAILTGYINAFWGQAGSLLPEPFDGWHSIPYRLMGDWWHAQMPAHLSHAEQVTLFQLLAACLLAFAVPILVLRMQGFSALDAGLGRPRTPALGITIVGILVTLPIGFWLTLTTPTPWGSVTDEALQFLFILPEHFLVFGVFGILLLPEGRLMQRIRGDGHTVTQLLVLLAAGINFGLVHVGTANALVLWTAFPLGMIFAAMTFISGSIWPAIVAHVTLNIVPMALITGAG